MNGFVGVPNSSTGTPIDVSVVQVGGSQVSRQRFALGDDIDGAALATVSSQLPSWNTSALVVRPINPSWGASVASGVTWVHAFATTLVKAGSGVLSRVIINSAGGTGNSAQLWDGNPAQGGVQFAKIGLSTMPCSLVYEINFLNGLYIVTVGGTECGDITIVFE